MCFNKGGTLAFVLTSIFLVTLVEKARGQETRHQLTDGEDCLNHPNTMSLFPILPQIHAEANANGNILGITDPANYRWICQTDQNDIVQYITLYDIGRNLPVYSAYKAAPYDTNLKLTARTRPAWDRTQYEIDGQALASDADYTGDRASLIDRGHLFAAQFASDQDQFLSTFKISNVCAQDAIFNRKVWGHAERILKIQAMQDCQGNGGIPLVVTGAIPENMAIKNLAHREYFTIKQQGRRSIAVPVLMWTTMWCMQNNEPQYHVSFIGHNCPWGKVMFYREFSVFKEELKSMYGKTNINDSPAWHQNIPTVPTVEIDNIPGISYANIKQTIWMSAIRLERINFIETLLINNLKQMGINVRSSAVTALQHGQNRKRRRQNRKRRSVSGPVSSSEIQGNSTVALVNILDKDPDAEFRFSKCSFVEENVQTGTSQEHKIDMENDKLIESSDKTGSDLTGNFLGEDGTIQEMQEEVSKVKTISIVLKPRTP